MMCRTRLIRRFPARESRSRAWLPEEASRGAVPSQPSTAQTRSANIRAAASIRAYPALPVAYLPACPPASVQNS